MGLVLQMESTPFQLEHWTRNAKVEIKQPPAELSVSREKGGWTMESKPIRVNMDTFEARKSYGMKSVRTDIEEQAQEGRQKAYEAIGRMVEEGNMMMDIHLKTNAVADISVQNMDISCETMMVFIPNCGPEISWEPNQLHMQYQMDRLSFHWRINKPEVNYQSGKVEFQVGQYNELDISVSDEKSN